MQISRRKKKENIVEYVIYMFHIEDVIRVSQFDTSAIVRTFLAPSISDRQLLSDYTQWYDQLIRQMKAEGIVQRGHLSELEEIIRELLLLHRTLLDVLNDDQYNERFKKALPALKDFQLKSNAGEAPLVEVGLNALYSKMVFKLKGQRFSSVTEEAFGQIAQLLGYLAVAYKKMKHGDLDIV